MRHGSRQGPGVRGVRCLGGVFQRGTISRVSRGVICPLGEASPVPDIRGTRRLGREFSSVFSRSLVHVVADSSVSR